MNVKSVLVLAALALGLVTSQVYAHSHLNCQAYAQAVVNQAKKNIGLGCGFSGPVWSTDFNFHFNWCNQNTTRIHHLGEQENIRAAQMNQCLVKVKKKDQLHRRRELYCVKYAKKAQKLRGQVNQVCKGQNGGEWPQTIKQDVAFCMAKGGDFSDLTNNKRIKQIKTCNTAKATKTYKPRNFRGAPLDGCFAGGSGCGKGVADSFCRGKGHKTSKSFATGGTNYSVYSFCLTFGAARVQGYIDAGGKCFCTDDGKGCSYFKHITCIGKK